MRIDINGSDELKAVSLAIAQSEPEIKKRIRQYSKSEMTPEWQSELNKRASTKLENKVISATSRVAVSDRNVKLSAGTVGRPLSGGLNPKTDIAAVEFGADRAKQSTYVSKSGKGKSYRTTRHTARQLKPRRRQGYVVFPSAKVLIPRFASLWVQTSVRVFHEAFEGKL